MRLMKLSLKITCLNKQPRLTQILLHLQLIVCYKKILEVAEIKSTRTSLARAYKPKIPFAVFMIEMFGYEQIQFIIKRTVDMIGDPDQLNFFLLKIYEVRKENSR